jgi:hypothetical protein
MKFSTIIIFLLLSLNLFSQGNLQFNQVILTEFTANNLLNGNSVVCSPSTITVPAGKVWKIEQSSVYMNTALGASSGYSYSMYLNNTLLFNRFGNSFTFSSTPMWLSEGSYTVKIAYENTSGGPFNFKGSINAIEFNIIP